MLVYIVGTRSFAFSVWLLHTSDVDRLLTSRAKHICNGGDILSWKPLAQTQQRSRDFLAEKEIVSSSTNFKGQRIKRMSLKAFFNNYFLRKLYSGKD